MLCVLVCGLCVCVCDLCVFDVFVFQHVLLGTPKSHYGHNSCHSTVSCSSHRILYFVP